VHIVHLERVTSFIKSDFSERNGLLERILVHVDS
jgi:hypothetical protein